MFNLEKATQNADAEINQFVKSLKVKDLKYMLKENEISFEQKLLKPALQTKLSSFLEAELTQLRYNDGILQLLPVWDLSLCKERAQLIFYHCDSKFTCRTVSEALEFQQSGMYEEPDDESVSVEEDNGDSSIICSSSSCSTSNSRVEQRKKKVNLEPKIHVAKSTFDFSVETNHKERARHSRLGFRERVVMKQQKFIDKRNTKKYTEDEEKIDTLKCHHLFCCDAIHPVTKNRCIAGPFSSPYYLNRHKELCENGNSKHIFPSIDSTTSVLIDIQQGKTSPLCLACGALPNRDDAAAGNYEVKPPHPIPECIDPCCVGLGCYRRDNKRWKHRQFRASAELLRDLETLFQDGENRSNGGAKRNAGKYNATEAVAVLRNMMDSSGRRKYRLDSPVGRLPTEKYVKSWFSRRKNKGAKVFLGGTSSSNDDRTIEFSHLTIEDLKEKFRKMFDCEPTKKILCIKLLEIDDEIKYDGYDDIYSGLKLPELEEECKSRGLPSAVGVEGLHIVLRSRRIQIRSEEHRSSTEYSNAVNITDAAEQILSQRNAQSDN